MAALFLFLPSFSRRTKAAEPGSRLVVHSAEGERVVPWPRVASRESISSPAAGPAEVCASAEVPALDEVDLSDPVAGRRLVPAGPPMLAAVVAVETDWELFERLGSVAAVVAHVENLFATVSAVYRDDLGTDLQLGELIVWTTPDDPFFVESGFLDALNELGDHWHAEHLDVQRALVHFVSGKTGILGGIGYHGVVCRADTPVSGHWGGGYSLSGAHGTLGDFRDAFLFAHEVGHNFRAYHTHCFNDLPLPGDPAIDHCYSGEVRNDGHPCYAGPVSMPADGGSIMSYCHLLAGGYGNITLSLGAEGQFGEGSERVVDRMSAHVATALCLVPADRNLFLDGLETGGTLRWSETVVEPETP